MTIASTAYDGVAVVWCEGAFRTPSGKTAHGLVRRSERYNIAALIDSELIGQDAGEVLDGAPTGIPIVGDLAAAQALAVAAGRPLTHLVIGLAPDGGRLPDIGRDAVKSALSAGLHVACGLHDFLSSDPELVALAAGAGVTLQDVRKPPERDDLHFFTGRIDSVGSLRVALLGTDSAVGKRTTAWMLVDAFVAAGQTCELIGTGQTAWLQGARFSICLDSLVNDFVSGELEHAVLSAWDARKPDAIVVEGQGSLMNPAYPGGFEILAATRPHAVVLQHAPARVDYDGFDGFPIQPLAQQIQAVELISGRPVVAITVNHENMNRAQTEAACRAIEQETGLVCCAPLLHGVDRVRDAIVRRKGSSSATQTTHV